uniref:Uncharacterized protein n=1 Tax=viral metagenome TaxID=1070528 RepID=A0A6M3LCN0_9ZZZZ
MVLTITLKNMARDTKLVVTIPGALNERLSVYMFLLEDIGIQRTKAEIVVTLAGSIIEAVIEDLESRAGHDEG